MTESKAQPPVRTIADIPGWFSGVDQWLFKHFLADDAVVSHGDLVEIGAFMGKSAVLIGTYRRPDETFTVCDLFGGEADDPDNAAENTKSYARLTRDKFEQNYLAIHDQLPIVIQEASSSILKHVKTDSARFVHVDGSHLYEHVAVDIESARAMLLPEGVVAFDDYRAPHTPGVAAAVWEAVTTKDLHLICLTRKKLYATFGDASAHQERLIAALAAQSAFQTKFQQIAGARVVRVIDPPPKAAAGSKPEAGSQPGSAPTSGLERGLRRAARSVRARLRPRG